MKMNTELRHKQNVLQAQLRSSVERKADMEADLKEKTKAIERLSAQLDGTNSRKPVRMHSVSRPPIITVSEWKPDGLTSVPSVQSSSDSTSVPESVNGRAEGSGPAVFHQEGGARHHLWEERAEDQPVPGAGGAQLLSKVNVLFTYVCIWAFWLENDHRFVCV